ncbi:alpha/beta hydrolase family protein [Paenibacillus yanchengensis]|uniref:Alpha/beta hydrolase family protein n=1 Tax=Paenibacillus yanchengensis TaxID=2035833 RepID=A0ABW4YIW2_9BACL
MNSLANQHQSHLEKLEQYVCTLYETKDQLRDHIYKRAERAFRAGEEARAAITTIDSWKNRKQQVKQAFYESIGMEEKQQSVKRPIAPPVQLVTTIEHDDYIVEKLLLEVRPKHFVTALLYKPVCTMDIAPNTYPAVLFLSGHEYEAKHSDYYHRVCLRFVQAGMIVLAIDPIGQGERISGMTDSEDQPVWGTGEHQRLGVQCYALATSIAHYFVDDAQRAIDYLVSRADVDSSKIAVTGNSGGGTQTAMMMLTDERIAAAAPATFIMNREQYLLAGGVQDAEQVWPGFTAAGFDHEDILLAFAPKPTLVCAVAYDFFPIEGAEQTVANSRKYWEMFAKAELLQLATDQSLHRYTDRLACQAATFFIRHLQAKEQLPSELWLTSFAAAEIEPLPAMTTEQLLVTTTGQVRTSIADARLITDELRILGQQLGEQRTAQYEQQPLDYAQKVFQWLEQRVVDHCARKPVNFKPRFVKVDTIDEIEVQYWLWWSQKDVLNSGYLFRKVPSSNRQTSSSSQPIAVAVWPRGTTMLQPYWTWIEARCNDGEDVLVVNVSGEGPHEPHPLYNKPNYLFFGKVHKLADELLWLNDSLAALRTYDVVRAIQFVREHLIKDEQQKVVLYGCGLFELYTKLAAVLAVVPHHFIERSDFTVEKWIFDHMQAEEDVMSVIFPKILKYIDLEQLPERVGEKQ